MAGTPLEQQGALKRTDKGGADWYYDNDGNGWPNKAAALAGVPIAVRERKTVLIDANEEDGLEEPTEYWWTTDTADTGLRRKNPVSESIPGQTPTMLVSYGWYENDPYPLLSGGTDNLTYQGTVRVNTDATQIITDMREGSMHFLLWKVRSGSPIMTAWNDGFLNGSTFTPGSMNYGAIPDSVLREVLTLGEYDYYMTRAETAVNQAPDSRVRLSRSAFTEAYYGWKPTNEILAAA